MILSLEIENFKGIAARQRIDFAPLTLLFGANSAGKSTILQALLYLHEVIERGAADVDRTELGGGVIELGGFARLVHRHESERAIVLRAEFLTPGGLERFGRDLSDFPFPDLDDEVESAWLELTIRFRTSPTFRGPLVERAVIGVNGEAEPLVWIETGTTLREGEPLQARVNLGHKLLATETRELPGTRAEGEEGTPPQVTIPHAPAELTEAWKQIAVPEDFLLRMVGADGGGVGLRDGSGFGDGRALPVFMLARGRMSALPATGEPLRILPFGDDDDLHEEAQELAAQPSPQNDARRSEIRQAIERRARSALQVRTFLEMVVLGTTGQLLQHLRDALYIGPLRVIPPRGYLYERAGRPTSWADGLSAWDLLLADRGSLVERTNHWLRTLKIGCQVIVQQLFEPGAEAEEISAGQVNKTVRRLLLRTEGGSLVLPSEVGAGVSQLIPVVVAALTGRSVLSLIEQPEIHVHPAVQVGLGDLFIDAVTREGSRRIFLIETHSEHLILRLLRRIRETTEQELAEEAPAFAEDKLSVLYIEASPDGVRIRRLRVDEHGEFKDRWPKGFFAERMEELL